MRKSDISIQDNFDLKWPKAGYLATFLNKKMFGKLDDDCLK